MLDDDINCLYVFLQARASSSKSRGVNSDRFVSNKHSLIDRLRQIRNVGA